MRRMNKVIASIVLAAFLINSTLPSISFSYQSNDTLATASLFDDLSGLEKQDMGRIESILRLTIAQAIYGQTSEVILPNLLAHANAFTDSIYKTQVLFRKPQDLPNGYCALLCKTREGDAANGTGFYYAVFSKVAKDAEFPIAMYTEEEFKRFERDGLFNRTPPKRGEGTGRNKADANAIKRHVQHEMGVDRLIRHAHRLGDAVMPLPARFSYRDAVKGLIDTLGLAITNPDPDTLRDISDRHFYLVNVAAMKRELVTDGLSADEVDELMRVTVTDAAGDDHPVSCFAHSSNNAIHLFITDEAEYEALTKAETRPDAALMDKIAGKLTAAIAHEIGVMTAQEILAVTGAKPLNIIDQRYEAALRGENPPKELALTIADLDRDVDNRDYAAGHNYRPGASESALITVGASAVANAEVTTLATTDDTARVAAVKAIFRRIFGRSHEIIAKAGGRDNAQGEHVDYNEEQIKTGKVHLYSMGGAIQNNFLATAARTRGDVIRIAHADARGVVRFALSDLKELQAIAERERREKVSDDRRTIPSWANHTMGVLMQAVERGLPISGADILITSNVPYGAGLSNSAANCVAVTMALDGIYGWGFSKTETVAFARDGEHDAFVGSTCGWLDQLLIVFSKRGFFAMIDYATKSITYFKSKLPSTMRRVLVNTNVPHELAATEYNDRNIGELPKAHETLRKLLPGRDIDGSTSLTLGEINHLVRLFDRNAPVVDFADRKALLEQKLITDTDLAAIDKKDLPSDDALRQQFAASGYEKPVINGAVLARHAALSPEESFALCLRRMRHQLTSAIRTPLTGKAAEIGDMVSFGALIDAEGGSLRMNGDFQITGENGAQDALLDIGLAAGEELGIPAWGRMEGGGGGGNVGFYVDTSHEAADTYEVWRKFVAERYDAWVASQRALAGNNVKATFIDPELSDGAAVVETSPRLAYLSNASKADLTRNVTEEPVSAVFVGLMCADKILKAERTSLIEGMVVNSLKLAGSIARSIDPTGEKTRAFIARLPAPVRAAIANLKRLTSGGPTTSSARICAQLAGKENIAISQVTSVGKDGASFVEAHRALGIAMDGVHVSDTLSTASTLITEVGGGDRAFLHDVAASAELTIDMLKPEHFRGKQVAEFGGVELTGLMPAIDRALDMAKAEGCITVVDTVVDASRQWKAFDRKYGHDYLKVLLAKIDVFAPSIDEARQIMADYIYPADEATANAHMAEFEPEEVMAFFAMHGAKAIFLKVGKDGVYVKTSKESVFGENTSFRVPILRGFRAVSGTGTGDAFAGALVYALSRKWDPMKSAMFADVVGGMCVQYAGGTIAGESLVDALYYMERLRAQMLAEALLDPKARAEALAILENAKRDGNTRFVQQVEKELASVLYLTAFPAVTALPPDQIERADFGMKDFNTIGLLLEVITIFNKGAGRGHTGKVLINAPNQLLIEHVHKTVVVMKRDVATETKIPGYTYIKEIVPSFGGIEAYNADGSSAGMKYSDDDYSIFLADSTTSRLPEDLRQYLVEEIEGKSETFMAVQGDGVLLTDDAKVVEKPSADFDPYALSPEWQRRVAAVKAAQGEAITTKKAMYMTAGMIVKLPKGTKHAFLAGDDGAVYVEVSGPSLDPADDFTDRRVVRLPEEMILSDGKTALPMKEIIDIRDRAATTAAGADHGYESYTKQDLDGMLPGKNLLTKLDPKRLGASLINGAVSEETYRAIMTLAQYDQGGVALLAYKHALNALLSKGMPFVPPIDLDRIHLTPGGSRGNERVVQIVSPVVSHDVGGGKGHAGNLLGNIAHQYTPPVTHRTAGTFKCFYGSAIMFIEDPKVVRTPPVYDPREIPLDLQAAYDDAARHYGNECAGMTMIHVTPGVEVRVPEGSRYAFFSGDQGFLALEITSPEETDPAARALAASRRDLQDLVTKYARAGLTAPKVSVRNGDTIYYMDAAADSFVAVPLEDGQSGEDRNLAIHLAAYRQNPKTAWVVQSMSDEGAALAKQGIFIGRLTPECVAVLKEKDDIPSVNAAGEAAITAVAQALQGHTSVITADNGVITVGANESEAYFRNKVVLSSLTVYRAEKAVGQIVRLTDEEVEMLLPIEVARQAVLSGDASAAAKAVQTTSVPEYGTYRSEIVSLRDHLHRVGREMARRGLVDGPGGNISVCTKDRRFMVIKASGMSFETMQPDQYVVVDLESGLVVEGSGPILKPSVEAGFHRAIYLERKDIFAVVHGHPVYSTALASNGVTFGIGGTADAALLPYIHAGRPDLANGVRAEIKGSDTILLAKHGAITAAATLDKALEMTIALEDKAQGIVSSTKALSALFAAYEEKKKAYDAARRDSPQDIKTILKLANEFNFAVEEVRLAAEAAPVTSVNDLRKGDLAWNTVTKEILRYGPAATNKVLQDMAHSVVLRPLALPETVRVRMHELESALVSRDRTARDNAVSELKQLEAAGVLPKPFLTGDVFQHCHTKYSYSPFYPAGLAWRAYRLGLLVTGIVDHDTVAGFGEFRAAAKALDLRNPTCGYEQRVIFAGTPFAAMTTNSPGNAGETYIAIHGVSADSNEMLEKRVMPAKRDRFRKTVEFVNSLGLPIARVDYDAHVAALAEDASPTERHVAEAIAGRIRETYRADIAQGDWSSVCAAVRALITACSEASGAAVSPVVSDKDVQDADFFMELIRNRVVTTIKQIEGYGPTEDEIVPYDELVRFTHDQHSLAYYCYLGGEKPCQAEERRVLAPEEVAFFRNTGVPAQDGDTMLHALFRYLKKAGTDGIAFMPNRNSPQEIREVIRIAREAGFTHIANGMDVNKKGMPYTYFGYTVDPVFAAESTDIVNWENYNRSEPVAQDVPPAPFTQVAPSAPSEIDREIAEMAKLANLVGRDVPTDKTARYTLLMTSAFYAGDELREHKELYRNQFELDTVDARDDDEFVRKVIDAATGKELRTVVLVPNTLSKDHLEALTSVGIRFVRVNAQALRDAQLAQDGNRAQFQKDTYVMMILTRRIDAGTALDPAACSLLKFYLKSHFSLTGVGVDEYLEAIKRGDVAQLINGCLNYRPATPYDARKEYDNISEALLSA